MDNVLLLNFKVMPVPFRPHPSFVPLFFLFFFLAFFMNLADARGKSLKDRMKEYIEAVRNQKEKEIIRCFPKKKTASLFIYTQGDLSKPRFQWIVDQKQIEKDFQTQGPLFHLFFDKTKTTPRTFYSSRMEGPTYKEFFDANHAAGLTYRDLLKKESKNKWKKKGKSFFLKSPQVCDYVRWKKKEGKWIIEELAVTFP